MKWMLLMYADPAETKAMSAADREVVARKHEELVGELTDSGELLDGAGLDYAWNTTTLRWRDGERPAAIEGPLADAAEHLTAYYVVDCERLERARSLAERLLDFHVVAVEVRRIHT